MPKLEIQNIEEVVKVYKDIFLPTLKEGIKSYDKIIETYDAGSLADLIGTFDIDDFLIFMQEQYNKSNNQYLRLLNKVKS